MLSRLRACDAVAAAHAANGAAAPLRALPEMLEGVAGAMQELRKKRWPFLRGREGIDIGSEW